MRQTKHDPIVSMAAKHSNQFFGHSHVQFDHRHVMPKIVAHVYLMRQELLCKLPRSGKAYADRSPRQEAQEGTFK